jgi:hypothetical protein
MNTPNILSEKDKEIGEDSELYFIAATTSQLLIEG